MTEKVRGFGIGELGRAPEHDPMADLGALERQPRPSGKRVTCQRCRASIPAILAMTSANGTVCPNCYDDAEY